MAILAGLPLMQIKGAMNDAQGRHVRAESAATQHFLGG
jgi:hypothetical protein